MNELTEPFQRLCAFIGHKQLAGDLGVNQAFLDEVCGGRFVMDTRTLLQLFQVVEEDNQIPEELKNEFRQLRKADVRDTLGFTPACEFQAATISQYEDLLKLRELWYMLRTLPTERRREIIAEALDSTMPKSNLSTEDAP